MAGDKSDDERNLGFPSGLDPKMFMNAVMAEVKKTLRQEVEELHARINELEVPPVERNTPDPTLHRGPPPLGRRPQRNAPRRDRVHDHRRGDYDGTDYDGATEDDATVQDRNVGRRRNEDGPLRSLKFQIPAFYGKSDPEAYLDWERKVELIFDCHNYSERQKVRVAVSEFKEYALSWWDNISLHRRRGGAPMIQTWGELTTAMRNRFVPSSYKQELLIRLQSMKQGHRSVDEFYKDLEVTLMRADVQEPEQATVARFLTGLNRDIADKVELYHYDDLNELVERATKVERQLKRKGKQPAFGSKSFTPTQHKKEEKPLMAHGSEKGKGVVKADLPRTKPVGDEPPKVRNRDIICFKCQGRGHIASQCPNKRTMIVNKFGAYETESESDEGVAGQDEHKEYDSNDESDQEVGLNLVTLRALSTMSRCFEEEQRENLFQARCLIGGKVCSLIIDSGSCTNIVSDLVVRKLNLLTTPHPTPFKLQWVSNCGEMNVNKQVTVPFKIKNYEDEVVCDVLPMQACHILLGRPWQFDKKANHDGYLNRYSFEFGGKKICLKPLSPKDVHEDQLYMQRQFLEEAKEKRERKKGGKNKGGKVEHMSGQKEDEKDNLGVQTEKGETSGVPGAGYRAGYRA